MCNVALFRSDVKKNRVIFFISALKQLWTTMGITRPLCGQVSKFKIGRDSRFIILRQCLHTVYTKVFAGKHFLQ